MFVVCEGFIITFRSYTVELPVYTLMSLSGPLILTR